MSIGHTLSSIGLSSDPHTFTVKRNFTSKVCQPCGKPIKFGSKYLRCNKCPSICHPICYSNLPAPCISLKYPDPSCTLLVAPLLQQCINEIETHITKSIHKMPSPNRKLSYKIYKKYSKRKRSNLRISAHVLSETVKLHLLINPTIPYWHLQGMSEKCDDPEHLKNAFFQLPKSSRDTLAFLLIHLSHVSSTARAEMSLDELINIFANFLTQGHKETLEGLLSIPMTFWLQSFQISSVKKNSKQAWYS